MDKARNISLKKLLTGSLGAVLGLVILVVVLTALSNIFLTPNSIRSILAQSGTNAIIAVGMTYVTISGNIDISVGAPLTLSSCVGATLMAETGNVGLSVTTVLLTSILLGLFNGSLAAYLGFPPFIVTLSIIWLLWGTTYLYTGGQAVVGLSQGMTSFATGSVFYIPNIVWLIATVYTIGHMTLQKTTAERKIYVMDDNSESARLPGINVKRVTLATSVLSGFCAALNDIMYMGRLNSGQPIVDQPYEMYAIAAAVISEVNLTKGGIGGVVDILIGAISISVLQDRLTILNVNTYWQQVCIGMVLLLAVGLDRFRKSVK